MVLDQLEIPGGGREGGREGGRKEGRKEGKKEGRKEGRKPLLIPIIDDCGIKDWKVGRRNEEIWDCRNNCQINQINKNLM